MNQATLNLLRDLNSEIRAAQHAVVDAEFSGVRGEEMLTLKHNLRLLKKEHARMIGK